MGNNMITIYDNMELIKGDLRQCVNIDIETPYLHGEVPICPLNA